MQQIRAQEDSIPLFEQHARIPAVGQVWRRDIGETVPARFEDLPRLEAARRPIREIRQVDHRAAFAAGRRGLRRHGQPLVERAALVDLEVAPANPAKSGRVDDLRHCIANVGKHATHTRMKEQWLVVFDQEMVELQVDRGDVDANAV